MRPRRSICIPERVREPRACRGFRLGSPSPGAASVHSRARLGLVANFGPSGWSGPRRAVHSHANPQACDCRDRWRKLIRAHKLSCGSLSLSRARARASVQLHAFTMRI